MLRRRALVTLALSLVLATVAGDASTEPEPKATSSAAPETSGKSAPARGPAPATTPHDHVPELEAAVRAIANDHTFEGAEVGIAVLDVDTGHFLATANEHTPLNPASNAKVFTAATALALLHGDHRYETTLAGTVKGNEVTTPLVLRGHGDPSLTSRDLWDMVQDLRAQGVRRVGDVVVDQHLFDESTTPPAFDQQPNEWASFRAPVSAVALDENTVTMEVRPTSEGQAAIVEFDPPGFVDVDGSVKTGGEGADTVGLVLVPNGKRLTAKVSGTVGADARIVRFTRRVDDPTLLAGYALKAILEQSGIKVSGDVKAGTSKISTVLARHKSEPLSTLLYALGKQSDNFYAEMVFKTLGGELKGRPAKSANGADLVGTYLAKVGAAEPGIVIKNGSGLFDANRVTTWSTALLLRAAWRDPAVQPEFVSQLSIGGVDGTLHKRFHDEKARRAVRAKTGTLDDVISLSGYVLSPPGHGPIAFSVIFNKVGGKGSGARAAADKLVRMIVRRQWGE